MKKMFLIVVILFSLFLISCESYSSQKVEIGTPQAGEKIKVLFLESEKEQLEARAKDIEKNLTDGLKGKHVLSVKTVYSGRFLYSGEIVFTENPEENLNAKFLSFAEGGKAGEKKIKEEIQREIESGQIKAAQIIYNKGRVVAAEIYY
ncbi:MAG: hypothetical protein WC414_02570 [Patescibacteria group bacterium]